MVWRFRKCFHWLFGGPRSIKYAIRDETISVRFHCCTHTHTRQPLELMQNLVPSNCDIDIDGIAKRIDWSSTRCRPRMDMCNLKCFHFDRIPFLVFIKYLTEILSVSVSMDGMSIFVFETENGVKLWNLFMRIPCSSFGCSTFHLP